MKESISYSFLLNIIIVFVFVCAAIITGIFSYYRAFRAGTAIVNEIEKYEGYNCISVDSISKKLNEIGYNLPFNIKCNDSEDNCVVSIDGNYKVISYNYTNSDISELTGSIESYSENIFYDIYENENHIYSGSDIYCGEKDGTRKCYYTSKYGYGVYTYMYTQLPVVSNFLKIPIYFKTRDMIDQRNLTTTVKDGEPIVFNFDVIPKLYLLSEADYSSVFSSFSDQVDKYYIDRYSGQHYAGYLLETYGYGFRRNNDVYDEDEPLTINSVFKYDLRDLFKWANSSYSSGKNSSIQVFNATSLLKYYKNSCGYQVDWSLY